MSVAFEELEDSPRIHIREQGTLATRVFRVAWDDWRQFVEALLGSYQIVGCSYVFVPPLEFPGLPNLVVSDVRIEPFADHLRDGIGLLVMAGKSIADDKDAFFHGFHLSAISLDFQSPLLYFGFRIYCVSINHQR